MQAVDYSAVTAVIIRSFENPELEQASQALARGTNAPAVQATRRGYKTGEQIEVVFANARGNSTDWIALAEKGAANDSFVEWQYIEGQETGYRVFPDGLSEPGEYEVRLFWNDGYTMGDSYDITVE